MRPSDYEYVKEGFMHPAVMAVMVVLVIVLAVIAYKSYRKREGNFMERLSEDRNVIVALFGKNFYGRYGDSYLGVLWNFLMPAILIAAICLTFTSIKNPQHESGYCIYLCSGFFVATMCRSAIMGRAFTNNSAMLKKLATPGWIIALADTIANFVSLLIAVVMQLVVLELVFHDLTVDGVVAVLLFLPVLFVFCFGCTLIFSTSAVISNDLGNLAMAISRVIVWVTPTFYYLYNSNSVLEMVSMWNPFTYFVEMAHQSICYSKMLDLDMYASSILIAAVVLLIGIIIHNRYIGKVRERI